MLSERLHRPAEGIIVCPLRSPTLPPATHTNLVLVGEQGVWVVDPAAIIPAERDLALEALRLMEAEGRELAGIVLTHHHRDHVGGAGWLRDASGLAIWAHPITGDLLEGTLEVDHRITEGDVLAGGAEAIHHWKVLHTPGHASGHIVLWQQERRWLVGGDMVAEIGTIIIEPPDGHMATYMNQLERLRDLEIQRLIPAHGAVIEEPVSHLEHYLSHRREREQRVLEALSERPLPLSVVTADSYPDVPVSLHPLAERSCLAHLLKLEEDEIAKMDGRGQWCRRSV